MNFYDATIRLQGKTSHEVDKKGLTAPEIMILRRIHGLDAVVRIVAVPPSQDDLGRSQREERDRLRKTYCSKDATENLVNELFGPDHTPLPNTLDEDEEVQAEMATRERELKDTNKTTVTQEQLDAMVEEALQKRLAEQVDSAKWPETMVDPDAADPETGRYPDHVIARNQAAGVAAASAKAAEKRAEG